MLTDNNREVIEWSKGATGGKIVVHNRTKLENDILLKYFRASKYISFQRSMNNYGFRRLGIKGSEDCSYINDALTQDLCSLLTLKVRNFISSPTHFSLIILVLTIYYYVCFCSCIGKE
jgi:hypothetical protein